MARTKLDRFSNNPETYRKMVNRTIESAMKREGINTRKELGQRLGYTESQIVSRFWRGKDGWSAWDIRRMNEFLYFTEYERNLLMGGPPQ